MFIVAENLAQKLPKASVSLPMDQAQNMTAPGGLVSFIRNDMGNGNNLQQGTSSAQPKNNTRTLNGRSVLEFAHDGILNDRMLFDSNAAMSQPFTAFIVAQYDTSATRQALLGRQTAAVPGQFTVRKESTGTVFNSFLFGSGGLASTSNFIGNLNPNIHRISFADGGGLNYAINNGATTVGTARSGYDNAVATPLALGCGSGSSGDFLDGIIAEVIICNAVLDANTIAGVNRYLSNKWGIAIS